MQSNAPGPFIRSAFAPAVLVASNQEVDEICKKNGSDFSFCSILEACGTTVPVSRGTAEDVLIPHFLGPHVARLLGLALPTTSLDTFGL